MQVTLGLFVNSDFDTLLQITFLDIFEHSVKGIDSLERGSSGLAFAQLHDSAMRPRDIVIGTPL